MRLQNVPCEFHDARACDLMDCKFVVGGCKILQGKTVLSDGVPCLIHLPGPGKACL